MKSKSRGRIFESISLKAPRFFLLSIILCVACSRSEPPTTPLNPAQAASSGRLPNIPAASSPEATLSQTSKAKQAIEKYNLSPISLKCLLFVSTDAGTKNRAAVEVRELHNQKCGGDPSTAPRLFTLEIDLVDGSIWTDAKSLSGDMERLK